MSALVPTKGTAAAIAVAARVGLPLVIAGIIQDQRYFDEEVAPHVDDDYLRAYDKVLGGC